MRQNHTKRRRRGVALIVVCILLILLLGTTGFAVDITRIMTSRGQLQGLAESAALAAVMELDGTVTGVEEARRAARAAFQKNTVPGAERSSMELKFASSASGPWVVAPKQPSDAAFTQVSARAELPLILVTVVTGQKNSVIDVTAEAEQSRKARLREGLFPYTVAAADTEAPHFGLRQGEQYTLRWADEPSLEAQNVCAGDAVAERLVEARSSRIKGPGYIEMVNRGAIRQSILYDYQTKERFIGAQIHPTGGVRMLEHQALVERIGQDTDPWAETYRAYAETKRGNGRRIVAVPIRGQDNTMIQVGAFFLQAAVRYSARVDQPFCAEYLGPYLQGSRRRGAAAAGYHIAVLSRREGR